MSVVTQDRAAGRPASYQPTGPRLRVTFPRVVASEWIKFRTLRSSWIVLLAALVAMVAIGALIGYNTGSHWGGSIDPEDRVASAPLQGLYLAQLLIGVLGVLFVSGEYTTGMIRSTLAAVPTRLPVLGAKAVVFGAVTVVSLVPASFVAFFAAQAFLHHYGHGTALSAPTTLRVIIATGLYLALIGLLGSALGWIVRSTPGGISALVGLLLVVPVILGVLPGQWSKDVAKYLPSEAGASFYTTLRGDNALSPGGGLLVLVLWVAGALVTAAVLLKRRDG
jgi:ABC-2 type transport system permease protein